MLYIFRFLSIFLLMLNETLADTCSDRMDLLFKVGRGTYQGRTIYESGNCHSNICHLLLAAKKEGVALGNLRVILIYKNFGGDEDFKVFNSIIVKDDPSRNKSVVNFDYHVILVDNDKVLDFDYSNGFKAVDLKFYLKKMFVAPDVIESDISKLFEGLKVRAFVADQYISFFDKATMEDFTDPPRIFLSSLELLYRNGVSSIPISVPRSNNPYNIRGKKRILPGLDIYIDEILFAP